VKALGERSDSHIRKARPCACCNLVSAWADMLTGGDAWRNSLLAMGYFDTNVQ
jgi:predicted alpha-1,6-mannanase (GH76 family)